MNEPTSSLRGANFALLLAHRLYFAKLRATFIGMTDRPQRPRRVAPTHHDPEAVRFIRTSKGWTQDRLAKTAGISPSLMSEIEKGTRSATPTVLLRFADVLNCPVTLLERKREVA